MMKLRANGLGVFEGVTVDGARVTSDIFSVLHQQKSPGNGHSVSGPLGFHGGSGCTLG